MKIFGIEIERKTDILALAAFTLALAGMLHQFSGYLHGPVVKLFLPEQVLIFADKIGAAQTEYVRFAAPMAYVNTGQPGYNAAIKSEAIRFTMAGRSYEQKWQEFGSSGSNNNNLTWKKNGDAHPFAIEAGSTESHETAFAPRTVLVRGGEDPAARSRNYLKWDEFITGLSGNKEFEITFVSEIYGKSPVNVKCKIYLTDAIVRTLKERKWVAPSCWAD
ncbi:MAG: hypothetical protein HYS23_03475 [Geobacter sp.]|nr:hypothetical protein [Geobacter sp.]